MAQLSGSIELQVKPIPDARTAIRLAIKGQFAYLTQQRKYVCRFRRVVRSRYTEGFSQASTSREDEIFFLPGAPREAYDRTPAGMPSHTSGDMVAFAIWDRPLFTAILAHAVFSAGIKTHASDGGSVLTYEYVPNPSYAPHTDLERIAQAVFGKVAIDEDRQVFRLILAESKVRVESGERFLVPGTAEMDNGRPMPLLQYAAIPYQGVVIPTWWNEASFEPVKRDKNEVRRWLGTLSRTFVDREQCEEYHIKSRMLP